MKKLNYKQLRDMWLDFWAARGHAVIPSASVVPQNDASVLFINSGMHPLVPYLMGDKHPLGVRLANIQRCIRTGDIDEVGDATHLTFFEMMGNWSLGDYGRAEQIAWSWEWLTDKRYLAIAPERIFVTCFEGDSVAPRDNESAKLWKKCGIPSERIFFLPKSENWWQLPSGTGPCGPCSEMFMELKPGTCKRGKKCNPACDCGRFVEIGNDVFMEFIIDNAGGVPRKASQSNVDVGMGLERGLCLSQGKSSVFDTELFAPALKLIGSKGNDARILAEHVRAAAVIITDVIVPSNTGQGYVLRRLIRRAVRCANKLGLASDIYGKLIAAFGKYLELGNDVPRIFMDEVAKFDKTLVTGLKEFEKVIKHLSGKELSGKMAFRLYETYGFPVELTAELCKERGLTINMAEYTEAKTKHAQSSQTAAKGAFTGGLADTSGATLKLHTAAHLLLAALRLKFGDGVVQKGSNITPERLRFDFNLDRKVEPDELREIEAQVNEWIRSKMPVTFEVMSLGDAKSKGAVGTFGDKYGEMVKVYRMGTASYEMCGGPHVANTGELGVFKIAKEESSGAGVRRIKAILS